MTSRTTTTCVQILPLRVATLVTRAYMRTVRQVRPRAWARTWFGASILCDTRDFIQRRIYFFKTYEHALSYVVATEVQRGDVFIDVGANIGYFTLLAASRVGEEGEVVAIEADRLIHERLRQNLDANPRVSGVVSTRQVAVTEKPCRVKMHAVSDWNVGSTAMRQAQDDDQDYVEGLPFDEIVGSSLYKASFVKIDIEGAERPVLESILANLPKMSPRLILAVELQDECSEFVRRFVAAGFEVYPLDNNYTLDNYVAHALRGNPTAPPHLAAVTRYEGNGLGDYLMIRQA